MSPLWRDQLRIVLYPDRVSIVRIRKGLRPDIASQYNISCEPAPELALWFAPLNALMQWLVETKPKKVDVVVVLSNHFVRYSLLPWSSEIGNAEEELAFARIHFEKVFGDIVSRWDLRISDAAYGSPRLVSAIDQELFTGLVQIFEKSALRLVSLQPYLMHALNDCHARLHKQKGLCLVVESGKACLLRFDEKSVLDIKTVVLQEAFLEELAAFLQREMLFCGLDERTAIYVHAEAHPVLPLEEKVAARFHRLAASGRSTGVSNHSAAPGDASKKVA